jgi:hypothetical protein
MIRTVAALKALVEDGETIAVTPLDNGRFVTIITGTGRRVSKAPLDWLVKRGVLKVIATDLCGDSMQWGAA